MQRFSLIFLIVLLSLFLLSPAVATEDDQFKKALKGLSSPDENVRIDSFNILLLARQAVLLEAGNKTNLHTDKRVFLENSDEHYAIRILNSWENIYGKKGFSNFIELRIQPQENNNNHKEPLGEYPFANILASIANKEILDKISRNIAYGRHSEDNIKLSSWVIYRSLGNVISPNKS